MSLRNHLLKFFIGFVPIAAVLALFIASFFWTVGDKPMFIWALLAVTGVSVLTLFGFASYVLGDWLLWKIANDAESGNGK